MRKREEFKPQVDPFTLEVIKSHISYACNRMAKVQQKTSHSPIIREAVDFSCSMYDGDCRLIGFALLSPIHMAAMGFSTQSLIKAIGKENLKEGDLLIMNDPYLGGTHNPDTTIIGPIFVDGELIAISASRSHWMDVGGGSPGASYKNQHIASEGLRLPPTYLMREGKWEKFVVDLMVACTRTPQYVVGDLNAAHGACKVAEYEVKSIVEKYGLDTFKKATDDLIKYAEIHVKNLISKLPKKTFEGESIIDSDGYSSEPIHIKVQITPTEEDKLVVKFDGTDKMRNSAVNSTYANTSGAVHYTIGALLDPYLYLCEGAFNPIKIEFPEDCFLNAKWPAATICSTTLTASKIEYAIWDAFRKVLPPEKMTGALFFECNWHYAEIMDPKRGHLLVSEWPPGGYGGNCNTPGMDFSVDLLCNLRHVPIESAESDFPLLFTFFKPRKDSIGPGINRGGCGLVYGWMPLYPMTFGAETSLTVCGAAGVNQGGYGAPQRIIKIRNDGKIETVAGVDEEGKFHPSVLINYPFEPGDVLVWLSGGGGGWGSPLDSSPQRVSEDVINKYLSIESAKEYYGVVINPKTMEVDIDATSKLRQEKGDEILKKSQGYRLISDVDELMKIFPFIQKVRSAASSVE